MIRISRYFSERSVPKLETATRMTDSDVQAMSAKARFDAYNAQNAARGIEEGLKGLGDGIQKYHQKYQQSLEAKYLLETSASAEKFFLERMHKAEQEAQPGENLPDKLYEEFSNYTAQLMANAPTEGAKLRIADRLYSLQNRAFGQALNLQSAVNADSAKASFESLFDSKMEQVRNFGDIQGALAGLKEDMSTMRGHIKQDRLSNLYTKSRDQLVKGYIDGMIDRDPNKLIEEVESGKLNDFLDLTEKKAALEMASKSIHNKESQIQSNFNRLALSTQKNLYDRISAGKVTEAEIDQHVQLGRITAEVGQHYKDRIKEVEETIALPFTMKEVMEGKVRLDPMNKEEKFMGERLMNHLLTSDEFKNMKPDEQNFAITSTIQNMGMIPDSYRKRLETNMMSGDEQKILETVQIIANLETQSPHLLEPMSNKELTMAKHIGLLVNSGMEPKKALQRAQDRIFNADSEAIKERRKESNLLAKEISVKKDFSDMLEDGVAITRLLGIHDSTQIAKDAEYDYKVLFKEYFIQTGDEKTAKELAKADMQKVYGKTEVGSPTLMKMPPELIYKNSAGSEWIKEQFNSELAAFGDPSKMILISDALTIKEREPSYLVFQDIDGVLTPVNNGARWKPDFTEYAADLEIKRSQEFERATEERKKFLEQNKEDNKPRTEAEYYDYLKNKE